MLKGIHITLMVGPVLPVPVPKVVLEALTDITVTTGTDAASGFQLTFSLSMKSPLHTIFLLTSGSSMPPVVRVLILVTINGFPEVLMDGVMTNHEISRGDQSGRTTLTVTGEDLSRVMDYIDFSGTPFPAMPPFTRVYMILAKYAALGVIPFAVPSVLMDVPIPVERIPRQQGTDLSYIKCLAKEVGYVFYVEPGPAPGTSTAYWGPEIRVGMAQPALNVDMDAHSNVESINFNYDTESASLPIIFYYNDVTKVPVLVPVPDVTPLSPPLGAIPPFPKKYPLLAGTSKLSLMQAAMIGLAKAAKDADAVSATGTLDVVRYGRVLKARKLVGLRGAGPAFDGLYFVKSVTHNIKRGEYKQEFNLIRNGLISTLRRVPV